MITHWKARSPLGGFARMMGVAAGGGIPMPPRLNTLSTPEESTQARGWVETFKQTRIPRERVELSFSRSSGPGGQNVNKVNTKATVRCPLSAEWIPLWAQERLRKSPHYVSSSHSLLITSTEHRSQAQNVDECLSKLHSFILSAASAAIVNEPSEAQKQRVRGLERAEKARRRDEKERRSKLKKSRSKGDWD